MRRNPRLTPLFGVAVGIAAGCGPSYQLTYEASARFEHCYALDETPSVSRSVRAACWRDWAARYDREQTHDRVEYAWARAHKLLQEEKPETIAQVSTPVVAAESATPKVTAPAPTSAFAPPPKTEQGSSTP